MICSYLLNCFRSISTTTVIARENSKNSLKVIFTKKSSLKAAIFLCFDVFPLQPTQKFQVQAKISRIWPVFPDCLSVNYDYDWRYLHVCYILTWIYENSERNPIKYLPRKVYQYLLFFRCFRKILQISHQNLLSFLQICFTVCRCWDLAHRFQKVGQYNMYEPILVHCFISVFLYPLKIRHGTLG